MVVFDHQPIYNFADKQQWSRTRVVSMVAASMTHFHSWEILEVKVI